MSTAFFPEVSRTKPFVPRRERRRIDDLSARAKQRLGGVLGTIAKEGRFGINQITINSLMEIAFRLDQFPYMNPQVLAYALVYYNDYLSNPENMLTFESLEPYTVALMSLEKNKEREVGIAEQMMHFRLFEELVRYSVAIKTALRKPPLSGRPAPPTTPVSVPVLPGGAQTGEVQMMPLQLPSNLAAVQTIAVPLPERVGEPSDEELARAAQNLQL